MSAACNVVDDFDKMKKEKALENVTKVACPQPSKETPNGLRILKITDIKTGKVDYEDKNIPKQL